MIYVIESLKKCSGGNNIDMCLKDITTLGKQKITSS